MKTNPASKPLSDYPEEGNCTCGHHWEFHTGGRYECNLCEDKHCHKFSSVKEWDKTLDNIRENVTFTKPLASPPVAQRNTLDVERAENWLKRIGCKLPFARRELAELLHDYSLACLATPTPEGTGWIDVKQALPEMDATWYLVYRSGYTGLNFDRNGFEIETAQGQSFWYSHKRLGFGATHYMPLPAAPAEPGTEGDKK